MTCNCILSKINNNYEIIFLILISLSIFTILFFKSSTTKTISTTTKTTTSKWSEHLKRLKYINIIAILMFISSVIRVSYDIQGLGRFLFTKSFLPLFGLLMSLTYFFGFFGVTIASSLFDDDDNDNNSNIYDHNNNNIVNLNRSPNDGTSIPIDSIDRIIVVGGGVAGCSAALALANKGHAVTLIERDLSEQDRIVGELLQPGGIRALERLGLDDCAKDGIDSVHVQGYVVIDPTILDSNGVAVKQILKYPKSDPSTSSEYFGYINSNDNNDSNSNENSPLGRSFHHGKFVQRLREKAIAHPSIHVIEGTVTKLIEEKDNTIVGVEYKVIEKVSNNENNTGNSKNTTDSDELIINKQENNIQTKPKVYKIYSKLTLVADGIWSSQRKHLSPSVVQTSDSWVGIIVKHESMKSPIPYPLHGHVILTEPSPCLIYQISSTETRVLVDIKGKLPSISDGSMEIYMKEKIAPQMPESFRPAFIEAITPGNPRSSDFKSMPSKYFSAHNSLKKGAFLIGDSLNMRNPLTGGGMTVCIRDGELLANYFSDIDLTKYNSTSSSSSSSSSKDNKDNKTMDELYELLSKRYELFLSKRINYAGTINVLACALHGVFSTPNGDETRRQLRQACYDYLNLGGVYSAGPIGLLSGLTPKPLVLTTHFFLVALYGSNNIISKSGLTFNSLNRIHKLLCVACTIIMPLLKIEQTTVLSSWFLQNTARVLFPPIQEMMTDEN